GYRTARIFSSIFSARYVRNRRRFFPFLFLARFFVHGFRFHTRLGFNRFFRHCLFGHRSVSRRLCNRLNRLIRRLRLHRGFFSNTIRWSFRRFLRLFRFRDRHRNFRILRHFFDLGRRHFLGRFRGFHRLRRRFLRRWRTRFRFRIGL